LLTYVLKENNLPLYEQVYQYIKADILNGVLKPGEKLPSKRTFANNNGISTITIQNAYDQLISEGYIYTIPKKGYYVADIAQMAKLKGQPKLTLDIRLPKEPPEYRIDLSNNRVNPDHFPFSVWAKLSREIIAAKSRELMEPSPTGGIYELRSAIAEHLKSFRGMLVDPDQIIIGAGTEYLYGQLIELLGFNLKYGVENPGYGKIYQIYKSHSVDCGYVDMDSNGIIIDELEKKNIDIIHISPSHHFPTGIIMPVSRRYELLGWAASSDKRYIIEDEYDSEFRFDRHPIPALQTMDVQDKVIYINTFTKTLSSTIRVSYMVLPQSLAEKYYKKMSFYSCTVSNFEQYTLAEFINKGYFEKHINRMQKYYLNKRDRLLNIIERSPLSSHVEISEKDSGLHFLMKIKTTLPDSEVVLKLQQNGIKVTALSQYYKETSNDSEHVFIINYSFVNEENLEMAVKTIYQSGILLTLS
jgi:GntR family transcriptional regulator/MocR family aminotransferase